MSGRNHLNKVRISLDQLRMAARKQKRARASYNPCAGEVEAVLEAMERQDEPTYHSMHNLVRRMDDCLAKHGKPKNDTTLYHLSRFMDPQKMKRK